MKRDNWPVGDNGVRPVSEDEDVCTYCRQPRGEQHLSDCVIRQRTVVVRFTLEYVTTIVEDDVDGKHADFHWNEGTHCMDNTLDELTEMVNRWDEDHTGHNCLCDARTTKVYVREATEHDEESFGVYVSAVAS